MLLGKNITSDAFYTRYDDEEPTLVNLTNRSTGSMFFCFKDGNQSSAPA